MRLTQIGPMLYEVRPSRAKRVRQANRKLRALGLKDEPWTFRAASERELDFLAGAKRQSGGLKLV